MATKKYTEEEARQRKNARQKDYLKRTGYASISKYQKENTKTVNLRFSMNTEKEMFDWLSEKPNKSGYIKRLIKKDMENN